MAALQNAATEAVVLSEALQKVGRKQNDPSRPSSTLSQLALVPLRPPTKKKDLEIKQLPIVLGRTNLAQWWYQSCDCQHYYCRLHCRPVAQNIGSLSKVMIQIDTTGKVFVVGKNPHLVTITPERNDSMLQVNDILSIGRRDREPWMRFQVVKYMDGGTTVPVRTSVRTGKRTSTDASTGRPQKKPKIAPATANNQSKSNNESAPNASSSNLSSDASPIAPKEGGQSLDRDQQYQQNHHQHKHEPELSEEGPKNQVIDQIPLQQQEKPVDVLITASRKTSSMGSDRNQRTADHGQFPEWITTTTNAKPSKGNRSTSSLSVALQYTSMKQQQCQAMLRRQPESGVANDALSAPNLESFHHSNMAAATNPHKYHHHAESDALRKRRRRNWGTSGRDLHAMNCSSKGIRSSEDLFKGSCHDPQIHLVLQDYDTSARLVKATQRDGAANSHDRYPRTDRIFISTPGEGPPTDRSTGLIPAHYSNCKPNGDAPPEQIGMLSNQAEAALMEVAAPAPEASDSRDDYGPPFIADEEQVGMNANKPDNIINSDQGQRLHDVYLAKGGDTRSDLQAISEKDSITFKAVMTKCCPGQKVATGRRGVSTQAEGEKTSELEHC
ncbi:hypothetical protein IV203_029982 [Nitzschia inconspicua]|uniref:Uncharacterized protein n=1 Tax=Nitzschia inconspicua TaxID=303405 RepID=A0A9K3LUG6_9STRA|nr:hypothetical protein IV203_029982 [Nitzschia inconspicua]